MSSSAASVARAAAAAASTTVVAQGSTPAPSIKDKPTSTLVLLRHGQSTWNKTNQFTGWVDVPLTEQGEREAVEAGRLLKEYSFDVAYVSTLKRAIKTLYLALEQMDRLWLPVRHTWRLNERHYGALQGLNKAETQAKFGEKLVTEWRRSYATPPPAVDDKSEHFPGNDARYKNVPRAELPKTESLKTTGERFMPMWEAEIAPRLKNGENVLIAAHGNSLRALVKHLDNISEKDIIGLNIPTGVPLVYEIDRATLKPIKQAGAIPPLSGKYLGDPEKVAAAAAAVAKQTSGGAKL